MLMTTIELDFTQRLKLIHLLSAQEGTLGKTAPFLRILEKIRFTDMEESQIIKTPVSDMLTNYAPPSTDFGRLTVDLETADAGVLVTLLESWPRFTPEDHGWANRLLTSLKK